MKNLSLLAMIAGVTFIAPPAYAQFSGDPTVTLDGGGRLVTLVSPFSYRDPQGLLWSVPAGAKVDGASIPQIFWSFIGGPFEGRYRNASIIHDYYCDKKNRPWRAVHRVFYDGMIAGGVPAVKAKIMYYAVYQFGPRWQTVTTRILRMGINDTPVMAEFTGTIDIPVRVYDAQAVDAAVHAIETQDLSLEAIEALADDQPVLRINP